MQIEITSVMDVINLQPSTKTEVADFVQKLISEVESGNENALKLAVQMNAMTKAFETVKKAINDSILQEARTYSEKTINAYGAEITLCAVKTEYNYESCGDVEWERYDSQIQALTESRKTREAFLKTITKPMTVVDESTGEVTTLRPPLKTQTDGIKISLK